MEKTQPAEHQMGAMSPQPMSPQPIDQQQSGVAPAHFAPGQYPQQPQQTYFQGQPQDPSQQPPPGYQQQPPMERSATGPPISPQTGPPMGQQQQGIYPGHPQAYGMPLVSLTAQPAAVQCPHCGHRGMTSVGYESGGFTHLMALLACCIVCLGCIPYCIAGLKDVHHKCSSCGTSLATYHRSGRTDVHYQQAA